MISPVRPLHRSNFENSSHTLLNAIAEAMHSMAQPLTVLRATLEVTAENALSNGAYQRAIKRALAEVSRVVDSMDLVQALITIGRDSTQVSPIDVRSTLAVLRDDLECVLQDAEVSLDIEAPEEPVVALASAATLRQCLFHLLQQALRGASHGDSINVRAESGDIIQIVVRHRSVDETNLSSPHSRLDSSSLEGRSLVLAEALATSQGGRLEWQAWPYIAVLALPHAVPAKKRPGTTANHCATKTSHGSLANGVGKS